MRYLIIGGVATASEGKYLITDIKNATFEMPDLLQKAVGIA